MDAIRNSQLAGNPPKPTPQPEISLPNNEDKFPTIFPDPHETERDDPKIENGTCIDDDSIDAEILRPILNIQAGMSQAQDMLSLLNAFLASNSDQPERSRGKAPHFPGVTEDIATSNERDSLTTGHKFRDMRASVEELDTTFRVRDLMKKTTGKSIGSELSPIHFAALKGKPALVKAYIERGAVVDSRESTNKTPLIFAAAMGHAETCRTLLEHGADINAIDDNRWTPLFTAIAGALSSIVDRKASLQVAQVLLDARADPDFPEEDADANDIADNMWTALHFTVQFDKKLTLDAARALIEGGADIDAISDNRLTPLYLAVQAKRWDVVEFLLDEGAQHIDLSNSSDVRPLEVAIAKSDLDTINILLQHGSSTDLLDKKGFNIVHIAAMQNDIGVFNRVIATGADYDLVSSDGHQIRPLHLASQNDNDEIAMLLLELGVMP
ncbi:hypothetical protein M426DRAFT_26661 [Hypoxylon sp. CI-4A]|nr:hypothetical protein M426DRAFT_26661 [Hypoxylon sp. CI-4A]